MRPTIAVIDAVTSVVRAASALTSSATTAKPRPASPARAASIWALSDRMLIWEAIWVIDPIASVTPDADSMSRSIAAATSSTRSWVACSERVVSSRPATTWLASSAIFPIPDEIRLISAETDCERSRVDAPRPAACSAASAASRRSALTGTFESIGHQHRHVGRRHETGPTVAPIPATHSAGRAG